MKFFNTNNPNKVVEYIKVSGKFLNENPQLHKYPDFKFENDNIYNCGKNKEGIIIDFEEY